nr:isoform 7 of trimethyllysine dioxygenase, mitochondrial [Quercus suber]
MTPSAISLGSVKGDPVSVKSTEDHNRPAGVIAHKCSSGNKVTVAFQDGEFTFHSQWLHDARCDDGASRNADTAIGRQPAETVRLESAKLTTVGPRTCLDVTWNDGLTSTIPIEWLRVMGPIVARASIGVVQNFLSNHVEGWNTDTIDIPEVSYLDIFLEGLDCSKANATHLKIVDHLLSPSSFGLIKVVDIPPPNVEDELNHTRNLNTRILNKLFGATYFHPARGADKSFNVSSRSAEAKKRKNLPNYDTNQVLLPHADHAFYEQPINVQGWYILEGTSENTFVSAKAALETLKEEDPESYRLMCMTPMTLGRRSDYYGESVYQMTIDTAISMIPGTKDQYKRIRWHPNFIGSLLSPYEDYQAARRAQQKFQEIVRRDTHQLKLMLKPGDMFIWDNFRILHGRERVFDTPRTGVGQTVPEQICHDRYRALCVEALDGTIDQEWIVHLPMPQLREMNDVVEHRTIFLRLEQYMEDHTASVFRVSSQPGLHSLLCDPSSAGTGWVVFGQMTISSSKSALLSSESETSHWLTGSESSVAHKGHRV